MGIAEQLQFGKCILWQTIGGPIEGLNQAVSLAKECRGGGPARVQAGQFIDLRMEGELWQMFIGQEISVGLL